MITQLQTEKPIVLISGVNLVEGGPLSIMKDAVKVFVEEYLDEYKLVLLINNKNLFPELINESNIEFHEYAYPKKSWLLKLWFEYVHCRSISKTIRPDLWFSIHDVTPSVVTKNKIVYCHNPAPFYKIRLREIWNEKTLFFFHFFYSFIYRINIKTNKFIIVQQDWLREEFQKRYKTKNVIVAYPDVHIPADAAKSNFQKEGITFKFFYPALPRSFKNFEVVLTAAELLKKGQLSFEVIFTFDGRENSYSKNLLTKYRTNKHIKFIGRQTRERTLQLYNECSCLIFPSKMETWGLPITEAKYFNKPMLVADERYAHETVGDYDKVCFFETANAQVLAALMEKAIKNSLQFHKSAYERPKQPFVQSWKELYELILPNKKYTKEAAEILNATDA
jgi:glycosyltransferase involved in cell wall biosynthesis